MVRCLSSGKMLRRPSRVLRTRRTLCGKEWVSEVLRSRRIGKGFRCTDLGKTGTGHGRLEKEDQKKTCLMEVVDCQGFEKIVAVAADVGDAAVVVAAVAAVAGDVGNSVLILISRRRAASHDFSGTHPLHLHS
jgi:hypothetical protein